MALSFPDNHKCLKSQHSLKGQREIFQTVQTVSKWHGSRKPSQCIKDWSRAV